MSSALKIVSIILPLVLGNTAIPAVVDVAPATRPVTWLSPLIFLLSSCLIDSAGEHKIRGLRPLLGVNNIT